MTSSSAAAARHRVWLGVTTVAGVGAAHSITYRAVVPGAAERQHYLGATGHGYWPVAVTLAGLAAVGSLAWALLRGAVGTGGRRRLSGMGGLPLRHLAAWQMGAFAVLELGERAVAGLPPATALASPELWLGLAVQAVVAAIAVLVLGAAEALSARAVAALRRRPRAGPRGRIFGSSCRSAPRPAPLGWARPRGPPTPVAS